MRLLHNNGDFYRGWDRGVNRALVMESGAIESVSEAEAAALEADFPGRFVDCGEVPDMHTAAQADADNVFAPHEPITHRKPARVARQKVK